MGVGSCGAWANGFGQILDGAGIRNTVFMAHYPGYDPSRTSAGTGDLHIQSQTAVLFDTTGPDGKTEKYVFDPYMATEGHNGYFKDAYGSEFNGQRYDDWMKWNKEGTRSQLYNASIQDNPGLNADYQNARAELNQDFLTNREFGQWKMQGEIKAFQETPNYQGNPDPERLRKYADIVAKNYRRGGQGLSDADIQEVLKRMNIK
jgi:hypothetical protein